MEVSIRFTTGSFTGERTHCTHWKGGWVGPRAGLNWKAWRKNPSSSPLPSHTWICSLWNKEIRQTL